MTTLSSCLSHEHNDQSGFTLLELMIVLAIIGVLAAMAYPSYQQYIIRSKRGDAMAYLQTEASRLTSQKLARGGWTGVTLPTGNYPLGATGPQVLYTLSGTLDHDGDGAQGDWQITATPTTTGMMKEDGRLTINHSSMKCRGTVCGFGDEWRYD